MVSRRSKRLFQIALVVGLTSVSLRPAAAQDLRVALTVDKSDYLIGEPIVAFVEITNAGAEAVWVDSRLDADLMVVRYTITDPTGEERPFRPYSIADAAHPGRQLSPGESVRGYVKLHFGADGWTFVEPGAYRLGASYRGYRSEPVTIHVSLPDTGPDAELAKRFVADPEVGKLLMFEEGDHLTRATALFEEIAPMAGSSLLARYAAYTLGSALSKSFAVPGVPARAADPRRAAAYFEQVKDDLPSAYFVLKSQLLLELCYDKLGDQRGRSAASAAIVQTLSDRYPARAAWRPVIDDHVERRYRQRD